MGLDLISAGIGCGSYGIGDQRNRVDETLGRPQAGGGSWKGLPLKQPYDTPVDEALNKMPPGMQGCEETSDFPLSLAGATDVSSNCVTQGSLNKGFYSRPL